MPLKLLSANHGAALAATLAGRANRNGRGFCSGVYPITPSTECMEYLCLQDIEKGRVIKVESEHSAMAVCIGAAAAGARSFTTTASNGLVYMAENCIAASYLRLPVVLAVANRTIGPPWNIWADHGDALLLRDHGLIQFYCADNQELFDTTLCAFRLAEDAQVMLPVMVNMEGFILSHTVAQIDVPEQERVDRFLPLTSIPHRLAEAPHALGQIEQPHQTEMHRQQHFAALKGAPEVYARIKAYAPYENVRPQAYPALLAVAGYHDSRVQYWEAAKWVAKLRAHKTDDHLLLLKTDFSAGHGGMSGRYQAQRDVALEYAFLLKVLGLTQQP